MFHKRRNKNNQIKNNTGRLTELSMKNISEPKPATMLIKYQWAVKWWQIESLPYKISS